ncbi:MAG: ABC transporter ATP-binding protein [Anaerolineae bacterium]|nr:ABC transporter ATP-binding protein [Anaerolineae bacterium]
MIEVHNLTKRYGGFTAVDSISFEAHLGQVTGFLGPNGAGKTTTMRMLTGYMPPSSGRATVAGFDIFEQNMEVRKRIGYLLETVPLYRDMTPRSYLMYIAEIRGLKARRSKADEALERVGMIERANSQIRHLSKGMRQRVGIAQAILHDPDVLILDEPTIGLDPRQVLELRDLVRELGKDHTLLFSTHILSEAEQVCDSVIIINRGKIVAQGAPVSLRTELERGGRVLVRLNASDAGVQTALEALRALPTIVSAELVRDDIIATPSNPDVDPRPEIARVVVEGGWDLVELRPAAVNLEEIFLEVTRFESADTPELVPASPSLPEDAEETEAAA